MRDDGTRNDFEWLGSEIKWKICEMLEKFFGLARAIEEVNLSLKTEKSGSP